MRGKEGWGAKVDKSNIKFETIAELTIRLSWLEKCDTLIWKFGENSQTLISHSFLP